MRGGLSARSCRNSRPEEARGESDLRRRDISRLTPESTVWFGSIRHHRRGEAPRRRDATMVQAKAKKMWALPGAELTAPTSLLMHGGDDTLVQLPCPSFLIEHPKGLVLFDTGCNPKIIDHAGGLTYFPNATFIVGAGELRYAYWPDPDRRWAFILNDYLPTRAYRWIELDRDLDLFGDGALQFLYTPGHTPGESTLLVNLSNRQILLPGDSVHLRAALEQEATMGLDTDPIASLKSLQRIKAIRDMHGATVWITHDPDDWKEHPHVIE